MRVRCAVFIGDDTFFVLPLEPLPSPEHRNDWWLELCAGLDIREQGIRGAYLLDVEDGERIFVSPSDADWQEIVQALTVAWKWMQALDAGAHPPRKD